MVELEGPQFHCSTLNCLLQSRDGQLEFSDLLTHRPWRTEAESEREARLEVEAENARLRAEIERLRAQ